MHVVYRLLLIAIVVFVCTNATLSQSFRSFGSFVQARSVSLDPQGNVYVADAGSNAVVKFDGEGKRIAEIGGYGWGQLEFDKPYGVSAANGLDVFVADYGNHRVQRYNRKLEYIATLSTRTSETALHRFGYPTAVATNRFGDLLVCDAENRRVLRFAGFQRVTSSFGGIDAGKGRLFNPIDIEVGDNDNVYVLEPRRVVVFDNFGNYVQTLGADTLRAASGFTLHRSSLYIIDGGSLVELQLTGKVVRVASCSAVLIEPTDQSCVDVAVRDETIYLLFSHFLAMIRR